MEESSLNSLVDLVGLNDYNIIFDSDLMDLTREGFVRSVQGRENVAVVIINHLNHIYGAFQKETIIHSKESGQGFEPRNYCVDPNHFIFSLRSDSIPPQKWYKVPEKDINLNGVEIKRTLEILPLTRYSDYIFTIAHAFGFWKIFLNDQQSGYTFFKLNSGYVNAPSHYQLTGVEQTNENNNTYSKITRLLVVQFY